METGFGGWRAAPGLRRARCLLALSAGLVSLIGAAPASAGTWTLQSVPTRTGLNGQLMGIACPSSTDCVAVGSYINSLGEQRALIEVWNGTAWSAQTAPSPNTLAYLRGVSCTSASACTAVGGFGPGFANRPLVERWNGTSWSTQTVTPPAGTADALLTGVSCISSTSCTAVGSYVSTTLRANLPLAEHWDGTSWSQQTTPTASGATQSALNGVACTGAASCYAVGDYTTSTGSLPTTILAEHWDGTNWTLQTMTNPAGATAADLEAISCSADSACTAVGGYATSGNFANLTLAERWNGTSWSMQTTVNPASGSPSFNGVSCPTATDCVATGSPEDFANAPLVEQWDGTTWATQSAPGAAGATVSHLVAVSCTTASACTAVGGAGQSNLPQLTLAETWNGTNWSIQTTANKAGAVTTNLSGVSCTTTPSCAAVGYTTSGKGIMQTLAETWDGTSWVLRTSPSPSATSAQLNSVSCTASTACTAVGTANKTHGTTLAERWDGSSWTVQLTTNRSSTSTNTLLGVSCSSSTSCMAVGDYYDTTAGHPQTLAEAWDGSGWTTKGSPNPAGATFATLSAVTCTSATSCLAVGGYSTTSGAFAATKPLAEVWDGSKWTIKLPKTPAGATMATLSGVSCVTATSCVAVGGSSTSVGATFPSATLAETWDGTSWTVRTTTNPVFGGFTGDSCALSTACTAVGQDYFAEDWNGTTWSTDTLATLPNGSNGSLASVSCPSSGTCTAAGANTANYVAEPIFANSTFVDQISLPLAEEDPPGAAALSPAGSHQPVTVVRPGVAIETVS